MKLKNHPYAQCSVRIFQRLKFQSDKFITFSVVGLHKSYLTRAEQQSAETGVLPVIGSYS